MPAPSAANRGSAFAEAGFKSSIEALLKEIAELYLSDSIPWVVGYSGGKDSSATLQLVWLALGKLAPTQRQKPVHVISTDTLVENPVVAAWVTHSLTAIRRAAESDGLPIETHRLTPEVTNTFWVNLIGRGYPAPRLKFRWCTERLKIDPSNRFIQGVVKNAGEAILILGTRKAESALRARNMEQLEKKRIRDRLSPNASLVGSLVFSPIEEWSNDDVWLFLMQVANPWGYDNRDLLTLYQGASADGECPLVVDTSTPSCGDSRFGCWVCTLVEKDKSMQAMILNDDEKAWMLPLLELRNALDVDDDRPLRDFRRMSGNVQLFHDRPIPGPYTQTSRENWLRRVLEAQVWVREHGPVEMASIELITIPELDEIRRLWVVDKHELEDSLPGIYRDVIGVPYPGRALDDVTLFGKKEMEILRATCGDNDLQYQMLRELLDVELRFRSSLRRGGIFDLLEQSVRKHYYTGEDDATERARRRRDYVEEVRGLHPRSLPVLDSAGRIEGASSDS